MKSQALRTSVAAGVAFLAMLPSAARSVTVTDDGSVVFFDNFESGNFNTSGEVLLRMMVYIPKNADADARGQFILDSGNRNLGFPDFSTAPAWIRPNGAGFVEAIGLGFTLIPTTVPYATDVWQEWDIDYVVGASTFGFSVNGVSPSGIASLTSGSVDFFELNNGVASSGSLFVDAVLPPTTDGPGSGVPEPSTFVCGAVGFAALWRRYSKR